MSRLWILGAPDPEMVAIESLLRECGEHVAYAEHHGERVHPGNAYHTDCTWHDPSDDPYEWDSIITIECEPTTRATLRIDHHRAGDRGFGRLPSGFLAASSLGQVIAELARLGRLPASWERTGGDGRQRDSVGSFRYDGEPYGWSIAITPEAYHTRCDVPRNLVLCAAADHCLGAAYRGECPGVDPDGLMRWRAESRAAYQRKP